MELVIALIPMFAWGSIALVSGKMGGTANQQTLGMTIGAFVFSLVVFFILQPTMTVATVIFGFISGVFWSVGQRGQFQGMHFMGVSVGLPLSTGMQLILNIIAGALLFGEWQNGQDFLLGGLALILLIAGSFYTSRRDPQRAEEMPEKEALEALQDKKVKGIYYVGKEPSLTVAGTGMEESILQTVLDSCENTRMTITNIMEKNPQMDVEP